jgi:hypothetical protein
MFKYYSDELRLQRVNNHLLLWRFKHNVCLDSAKLLWQPVSTVHCNGGRRGLLPADDVFQQCSACTSGGTAEPNPKVPNTAEVFECHPDELSRAGGAVVFGVQRNISSYCSCFDHFLDNLPFSCTEWIFNNGHVCKLTWPSGEVTDNKRHCVFVSQRRCRWFMVKWFLWKWF